MNDRRVMPMQILQSLESLFRKLGEGSFLELVLQSVLTKVAGSEQLGYEVYFLFFFIVPAFVNSDNIGMV